MKRAFTLVELLVVVGMIALLTGAVSNSVSEARARARIAKAQAEVKEMTNAILAYENFARSGNYALPEYNSPVEASDQTLAFILGKGESGDNNQPVPVLYNGSVSASDGTIRDPWGQPYLVRIRAGSGSIVSTASTANMQTGFFLPNFYRLSVEERNQ